MREKAAIVVAVLMLYVGVSYSWQTWHGQIQPVFASWLLFCVSASLSFWTYWSSKQHSLVSNVANAIDCIIVWLVLATMILLGKESFAFNPFEQSCLTASLLILIFWRLTKQHEIANLALQAILVIGYLPLLHHLWYAARNTEPLGTWLIVWIATAAALVPAIIARDKLAMIYAGRACVLVTLALILMMRLELR